MSRSLKGTRFRRESDVGDARLDDLRGSFRDFDADFLRWMLSDGAGSVVLEGTPHAEKPSLRIEWIELKSYANEYETCMYTGMAHKASPRAGNTWLDLATIAAADQAELLRIRQDTQLLPQIVKLSVEEYLRLIQRGRIVPEELDHLLCHYSSHFFKGEIVRLLEEANPSGIPEEKWFTNLYTKGNTGAASIFIMLEEALNSGRFKPGEKILLMVPESGRFTVSFALRRAWPPMRRRQRRQRREVRPTQAGSRRLGEPGRSAACRLSCVPTLKSPRPQPIRPWVRASMPRTIPSCASLSWTWVSSGRTSSACCAPRHHSPHRGGPGHRQGLPDAAA